MEAALRVPEGKVDREYLAMVCDWGLSPTRIDTVPLLGVLGPSPCYG